MRQRDLPIFGGHSAAPAGEAEFFDREAETMPEEERAALQASRLAGLTQRLLAAGGVQATRLRAAGVTQGRDVTLATLADVPFTRKQDLWDSYPFGMIAVPRDEVAVVHGSSGTGGRPTLVAYTRDDVALWSRMCARALAAAGATRNSTIHNAYGYGLFTGGIGIHQGALCLGAAVVPVSGGMTTRQLRLLQDLKPDILTCTPSYAIRLGEALAETGRKPADLNLRAGLFGAEPWSEPMRARIQDLLGLRALDIYGLSEVIGPGVAAECLEADGLHVNEDHFLVEAIDPMTGNPVPDGSPGELVFSTLTKQALPLLRYRTGDIAALRRGRCRCGRTLVKMTKVTGRTDDMLVLRGVNIYPAEVERVLLADGRLSPHYLLVVDARAAIRELIVAVEPITAGAVRTAAVPAPASGPAGPGPARGGPALPGPPGSGAGAAGSWAAGSSAAESAPAPGPAGSAAAPGPAGSGPAGPVPARSGPMQAALERGLEGAIRQQLGIRARVRVLPAGTVPRTEVGKAVRVATWTGGEAPLPGIAEP